MRKSINSIILKYLCFVAIFMFSVAWSFSSIFFKREAYAEEIAGHSIFIASPTYSVFCNSKVFFIDDYDSLLKIYDTVENKFLTDINSSVDLSEYGEFLDGYYQNENLFLLSEMHKIVIINLNSLEVINIDLDETELYTNFSVSMITDSSSNLYYVISLVTQNLEQTSTLKIVVLNNNFSVENTSSLLLNSTTDQMNELKSSLIKFFVKNSINANELDFVFIYGTTYTKNLNTITISSLLSGDITISDIGNYAFNGFLSDFESDQISISNVQFINISNTDYLLVTYLNSDSQRLYKYNDSPAFGDYESFAKYFDNEKALASENYVTYAIGQEINYITFTFDGETVIVLDDDNNKIKNPDIKLTYYSTDNFIYLQTTTETTILSSPWSFEPIKLIPENSDIVCVASAKIDNQGENMLIEDFYYCLYTFEGHNYLGYVKAANVAAKTIIPLSSYRYSICRVNPNSNLYSLPTKSTGNLGELDSYIIQTITDNSRIKILDVLCGYESDGAVMLKVQVNESAIGYIEKVVIIDPNDKVNFIITNASIKEDNTIVYFEPNKNSEVWGSLKKDYRIRINGARDTKSGFTSISFNDEYGNKFSGYIITDAIGADSWSALQIVGLILIAINIGLLILILRFRKQYIGNDGQIYVKHKKPNYVENSDLENDQNK